MLRVGEQQFQVMGAEGEVIALLAGDGPAADRASSVAASCGGRARREG
jgi:hypothetical protein